MELNPAKKKFCGPNWGRNDLFYSNVVKHRLNLTCFNPGTICYASELAILQLLMITPADH